MSGDWYVHGVDTIKIRMPEEPGIKGLDEIAARLGVSPTEPEDREWCAEGRSRKLYSLTGLVSALLDRMDAVTK